MAITYAGVNFIKYAASGEKTPEIKRALKNNKAFRRDYIKMVQDRPDFGVDELEAIAKKHGIKYTHANVSGNSKNFKKSWFSPKGFKDRYDHYADRFLRWNMRNPKKGLALGAGLFGAGVGGSMYLARGRSRNFLDSINEDTKIRPQNFPSMEFSRQVSATEKPVNAIGRSILGLSLLAPGSLALLHNGVAKYVARNGITQEIMTDAVRNVGATYGPYMAAGVLAPMLVDGPYTDWLLRKKALKKKKELQALKASKKITKGG